MNHKARNFAACLTAFAGMMMVSSSADALLASVKATGMAATMTAYPMDSFAGVYNPAGIVDVEDRIDIEGAWDQTGQSATLVGNRLPAPFPPILNPATNGFYDGGKTKNAYLANFGINKHLHCMPCEMTVGLVFYNRNFLKTTYGRPNLLLGTSPQGMEYVHETLSPLWAIKFLKHHSFGVSLNLNFQRFKINGLQNFDNALFSAHPGFVTNNGYNWSSGVGVTLGWLSRFWCDRIKVGVSYQFHTTMSKFRKYRGFFAQGGTFNIPQRWQAGISFRWIPQSTVAFDVEYLDWNQIKALNNKLADNLLEQALGLTTDKQLGRDNGSGFGFKRQIFYRVGIDYKFGQFCWGNCHLWDAFTLRTGFRHVNSPFDNTQTGVNFLTLDTVLNFWTIGFTVDRGCFEFSGFYAHGFQREVKGKNSVPSVLGGGEVNLKQRKNAIGLSAGYKF